MATIRRFIKYWRVNFRQSLRQAKESHTMTIFLVTLIIAVLSWKVNLAANPNVQEIIKWLATFGAVFWFLAHVFWTPFRRHEEQEKAMEEKTKAFDSEKQRLDAEIQRLGDKQTHLTAGWNSIPPCLIGSQCNLEIHNTNTLFAAQNVKVELVLIDPIPRSLRNHVFPVNLRRIDETGRIVNPNCQAYFELFTLEGDGITSKRFVVIRDENENCQRFEADDTIEMIMRSFYRLLVRVSSKEGPSREFQFELRFPTRGGEPFYLEPVRQA
jgi:hypothetical protein